MSLLHSRRNRKLPTLCKRRQKYMILLWLWLLVWLNWKVLSMMRKRGLWMLLILLRRRLVWWKSSENPHFKRPWTIQRHWKIFKTRWSVWSRHSMTEILSMTLFIRLWEMCLKSSSELCNRQKNFYLDAIIVRHDFSLLCIIFISFNILGCNDF